MSNKFIRSEFCEQVQVIDWLKLKYPNALYNGSPAGARYGTGKEAIIRVARQKRAGAVAGFPDIFIYEARDKYHGLAIELKREDGKPSSVSLEQTAWIDALNKRGYAAVVCYGFPATQKVIADYLT